MDATIIVAIITCFGVCLGSVLTFIFQMRKLRTETEQASKAQTAELNKSIQDSISANRNEYLLGIGEVKKSVAELNLCMVDLKGTWQQSVAMTDLRMQNLTGEITDLKTEVREHNNFAKRLPVLEEKMSVANHRIADLERKDE